MEITDREKHAVTLLLDTWYGSGFTQPKKINKRTLEIIADILKDSLKCSRALSFVPQNPLAISPYLVRHILYDLVRAIANNTSQNHHCLKKAALSHKTRMYCQGFNNC